MKTSAIILALATFALADILEGRDAAATTTAPPTTTYSLSPEATCLAACAAGDVNCAAGCVGSAHPNSVQVNQTDVCVTNCPQGDGSIAESNKYDQCVAGCIASFYLATQTAGPVSVGSDITTSASAGETTSSAKTGTTATTTGSSSATGSAAAASSSKAAGANNAPYITSVGGLAGLFLAFFAL